MEDLSLTVRLRSETAAPSSKKAPGWVRRRAEQPIAASTPGFGPFVNDNESKYARTVEHWTERARMPCTTCKQKEQLRDQLRNRLRTRLRVAEHLLRDVNAAQTLGRLEELEVEVGELERTRPAGQRM